MVMFWATIIVLVLAGLFFSLWPLIKKDNQQQDMLDQKEQNLQIARERIAELDTELANGELAESEYQQIKGELESTLYFDLENNTQTVESVQKGNWGFVLIALLVPLLSIGLYLKLGSTVGLAIEPGQQPQMANHESGKSIVEMVKGLVERLKEKPDDQEGWYMLGKTMMSLGRYSEAVMAYRNLLKLNDQEPLILVSLADAIAMARGGDLQGEPDELVLKALQIEPENATALWLAGMAASKREQHQQALDYWQKLYPQLQEGDGSKSALADLIRQAEQKLGIESTLPESVKVHVTVNISDELRQKANPDDLVFIYAKAMQGPPMPLAALRMKVSDLPAEVTLDDSLAMMPQMKLSLFDRVIVGARVSKSGQPVAQSGDFEGEIQNVDVSLKKMHHITITSIRD